MASPLDRTSRMGLFPHDKQALKEVDARPSPALAEVARDATQSLLQRDQAVWTLINRRHPEDLENLLLSLAASDTDQHIRESASWGLLKIGSADPLRESLSQDDAPDTRAWKLHLIAEATGSYDRFDERPTRILPNKRFMVTMPLQVEGLVEFKDDAETWHQMSVSQAARKPLVGLMTAGVEAETFATRLIIQKRIPNLLNSGRDFVEGYRFEGLSRLVRETTVAHYYQAIWRHSFYNSGRTGDESQGTVDNVQTYLVRIAETDLAVQDESGIVYPQSVRGVFHGSVRMDPAILTQKDIPLDGLLQILSTTDSRVGYKANGWFYGTFRGVPRDVDGDGTVELNGIDMFVDNDGNVLEQRPVSP